MGQLSQALEAFDQALQIDPESALAYANRALTRPGWARSRKRWATSACSSSCEPLSLRQQDLVTVPWLKQDEPEDEQLRRFRTEAAELINVSETTSEEEETENPETKAAGEQPRQMEPLTGPASAERLVCAPGVMTLAIISQAIDLNQQEYRAMSFARLRNEPLRSSTKPFPGAAGGSAAARRCRDFDR